MPLAKYFNGHVHFCLSVAPRQQEAPPEPTKTKEEIRLEQMKRKVKIAALEWDDFLSQEQYKDLV